MQESDRKIGFIGGGNMGEAFIRGIIRSDLFIPSMILVSDPHPVRSDLLRKTYGIVPIPDNFKLFSECDIVVLSVKPQVLGEVCSEIAGNPDYHIGDRKLVISIAAGIPIRKIKDILYAPLDAETRKRLPIIRVMPNLPALVLAGISGMSGNRHASADDISMARKILDSMGKVIEFKEEALDAVTGLSGNGPAYVFYLVESMIAGGVHAGLDPEDAAVLTINTLKGALAILEQRHQESPEVLRRKVATPGGTTEAAFKVLERNRVKESFIEAIAAGTKRSRELSRQ
jgi:pyrroline-5-carboxylate reductase